MNKLAWIVLVISGVVSAYAIFVSLWTARALQQKKHEAYRRKQEEFDGLDKKVKNAFADLDQ